MQRYSMTARWIFGKMKPTPYGDMQQQEGEAPEICDDRKVNIRKYAKTGRWSSVICFDRKVGLVRYRQLESLPHEMHHDSRVDHQRYAITAWWNSFERLYLYMHK